jgi:putative two-component system response regulator
MTDLRLTNGSILIIDDEPCNIRFLDRLLRRNGYTRIHATTNPLGGLEMFATTAIDLVLLDLGMPGMDGFRVMAEMKRCRSAGDYVPILVLTGNPRPEVRNQALANGARDFLAKPFDPSEALLRIENLLDTRYLQQTLARHNETLEARVRGRTRELEEAQLEILSRLATVAEYYDEDTAEHTRRVASMSEQIARELGMADAEATLLGQAALLHDVGKIAVPTGLTRKPGRLDSAERDVMQRHAVEGARVLSGSRLPLMQLAEQVARSHHERWDGKGYPDGLRGEDIPLCGRIVAVADVYDALTNVRPYKGAWSVGDALAEIRAGAGTLFDARIVRALERVLERAGVLSVPRLHAPAEAATTTAEASGAVARLRSAVRRPIIAALLVLGALVALPAGLTAQGTQAVGGMAVVTIPPLARITTLEQRVLPATDAGVAVELTVGVRSNTTYRLSVSLPADAGPAATARVEGDTAEHVLRGGNDVVVAGRGQGPGEQVHVLTVWLSAEASAGGGVPVLVQVDVD